MTEFLLTGFYVYLVPVILGAILIRIINVFYPSIDFGGEVRWIFLIPIINWICLAFAGLFIVFYSIVTLFAWISGSNFSK